jgi:hypothetical protein
MGPEGRHGDGPPRPPRGPMGPNGPFQGDRPPSPPVELSTRPDDANTPR